MSFLQGRREVALSSALMGSRALSHRGLSLREDMRTACLQFFLTVFSLTTSAAASWEDGKEGAAPRTPVLEGQF